MTRPSDALARADRRRRAAELAREGVSLARIGDQLGVNKGTISRDLRSLREQATVAARADVTAIRDDELRKLDAIESDARAQFEKKPNPNWLRILLQSAARRAALLGLDDAVSRVELTGPNGSPLGGGELRADEQRANVIRAVFERHLVTGDSPKDMFDVLTLLGIAVEDSESIYAELAQLERGEARDDT